MRECCNLAATVCWYYPHCVRLTWAAIWCEWWVSQHACWERLLWVSWLAGEVVLWWLLVVGCVAVACFGRVWNFIGSAFKPSRHNTRVCWGVVLLWQCACLDPGCWVVSAMADMQWLWRRCPVALHEHRCPRQGWVAVHLAEPPCRACCKAGV